MTKDEALRKALGELEEILIWTLPPIAGYKLEKATADIKEALAQPEQEPVAWLQFRDNEPPVVAPRDLGTPVFLGIRGSLAHDAQLKEKKE